MKIKLMSDLHLEFGGMDPGEGDVLILAGDILVINELNKESPQGNYFKKWLKRTSKNYKKVFMVCGNHEFYYSNIDDAYDQLREALPENITLLQNSVEEYEGVNFIGATMWSNYNEGDPDVKLQAMNTMNDFFCISQGEVGLNIVPNDVLLYHDESVDYINRTVKELEGPVVVVSHHAPSLQSISGDMRVDNTVTYAYASNLENVITENPNIKVWCHGHIHNNNDYRVGECSVISNPRGYAGHDLNPDFDPELEFTVPVKEVAQAT